ncbi:MAG: hypothetical protein KGR26_05490 [Cyanobacteria bacterium REEB65]|nr:hypothetical protein [Cyanobacteria bacterium REEB65]
MIRPIAPLVLALAACSSAWSGSPSAPLAPAATPPTVDIRQDPASLPPGLPDPADMRLAAADPAITDFDDPTASASDGAYLPGHWKTEAGAIVQDADGPSTKLMVRRFVGPGAGPQGELPDRYRLEVSAWEFDYHGNDPGHDPGVLAVIPYWQDVSHFVILSAQDHDSELWADDGRDPGEPWPQADRLWTAAIAPTVHVGVPVTWDIDVDVPNQHLTVYTDGQRSADASTPFLTDTPHQLALAANGDEVRFKGFRLWVPQGS